MPRVDERRLPVPPSTALYDYFRAALEDGPRYSLSPEISDAAEATRMLSSVEKASCRITVGPLSNGIGPMHEAAARLRVMDARGVLPRISAHTIAQGLQTTVLRNAHPTALRRAARGWLLLELADRFDLIEAWLDSHDAVDPRRYRRLRLRDRMNEIRNVHIAEKKNRPLR